MKSNIIQMLLVSLTVLFCQCARQNVETNNSIRFDDLKVGQKSLYAGFSSKTPHADSDTAYKSTGDTLVLTVVAQDAYGYKISEEWLNQKIKTVYYYFKIEGDSLLVKPQEGEAITGSSVFYKNNLSYVLKSNNLPSWTVNRWGVIDISGVVKSYGKINSTAILSRNYDSVIAHYDSTAIIWDGAALTQLYNMTSGFICFQSIGYFRPSGTIFYKIP